jgi:hypothetical protein
MKKIEITLRRTDGKDLTACDNEYVLDCVGGMIGATPSGSGVYLPTGLRWSYRSEEVPDPMTLDPRA